MVNGIKAFKHISYVENTGTARSIMSLNSFSVKTDAGAIFASLFPISRRSRSIDFQINYSDSVVNFMAKGSDTQSS